MFSKMLILIVSFIGFFILVLNLIPTGYFTNENVEGTSIGVDPEIAERLELANVTVYGSGGGDNMTYDYTSLEDTPVPPNYLIQGTTDDFIEIWWGAEVVAPWGKGLEMRHATRRYFPWTYFDYHKMTIYYSNKTRVSPWITAAVLESAWDSDAESSAFYGECDHASMSVAFGIYNSTRDSTITEAWNNNEITYALSYDTNWNASAISASTILLQLMLFQAPDLGFHDYTLNQTFNALIALPVYTMVAALIVKILLALFPTSPGVQD